MMRQHDKILRTILPLGFVFLAAPAVTNAQSEGSAVNCAVAPYYRQMAEHIIKNASIHLLNKKLEKFGGAKKVKVILHRCEASAFAANGKTQFHDIDASYELSWREKKLIGGKKYYLTLDALIEADGTAANFDIIDASHDLNIDFIRAFPLETQYFNIYKK